MGWVPKTEMANATRTDWICPSKLAEIVFTVEDSNVAVKRKNSVKRNTVNHRALFLASRAC
jgi:hypothetical protein